MLPLFSLTGDYSCAEYRLGWERKTSKKPILNAREKSPAAKMRWRGLGSDRLQKQAHEVKPEDLFAYFADADAR